MLMRRDGGNSMYMQELPVINLAVMGNETKTQGCTVEVQCQTLRE
jgi:hypothetical protein